MNPLTGIIRLIKAVGARWPEFWAGVTWVAGSWLHPADRQSGWEQDINPPSRAGE